MQRVFPSAKQRHFILWGLILLLLLFSQGCSNDAESVVVDFNKTVGVKRPGEALPAESFLRVTVASMTSPKATFVYYRQLLDYIGMKMGREVQLIQRKTYEEVDQLLAKGQIDLAFICSGPYVTGKEKYGFDALAVPQVRGKPFYQSYLIVNKESQYQSIEDLRGRIFAFTDPNSNTGNLVPTYWLMQMGESPESFFKAVNYTYAHDNSIMAVAKGLVDAAAVESHIWEYYNQRNPIHTSRTRVIKKSEVFGSPPLVASKALSAQQKEDIQQVLITMHNDSEGKRILNELMIEQFVPPKDEWYHSILRMKQDLRLLDKVTHATAKP
ncbi:MAG: phosphate/phosphite/phosphonate ABC transporter substrate-binding protein [Thermodesulfobacteriota bacterium]